MHGTSQKKKDKSLGYVNRKREGDKRRHGIFFLLYTTDDR
jgi:hypothetical protein